VLIADGTRGAKSTARAGQPPSGSSEARQGDRSVGFLSPAQSLQSIQLSSSPPARLPHVGDASRGERVRERERERGGEGEKEKERNRDIEKRREGKEGKEEGKKRE